MSRPTRLRLFDILDAIHSIELILLGKTWRVAVEDLAPLKTVIQQFYAEVKRPADPWPDAEPK